MKESPRDKAKEQIAREYYRHLSAEAEHCLRWSKYVSPALTCEEGYRLGLPRLVLWDDAVGLCDDNPWSLTVLEPFDRDARLMVRSAAWLSRDDFHIVHDFIEGERESLPPNPSPTIKVRDCRIDRLAWEEIMKEFYQQRFPLFWSWESSDSTLCTDCPRRGLIYFDRPDPQGRVEFSWGYVVPPGFEALPKVYQMMCDWLNERLGFVGVEK